MNIILINNNDFTSKNTVNLKDRRFIHIKQVHKATVGKNLKIGKINGQIGVGVVTAIDQEQVTFEVDLTLKPPPPIPIRLLLALPRPKNLSRILQTITTLGVKDIHIINSLQVEKSFWQSELLSEEKIKHSLILGLEQAGETILPKITLYKYFKPFIEDIACEFHKDSDCFAAHPVTAPINSNSAPSIINNNYTTIAIGPENGFIDYEISKFKEQNFKILNLGKRILKVETAITTAISLYI